MLGFNMLNRYLGRSLLSVTLVIFALSLAGCGGQQTGVTNAFDGEAKNLAVKQNMKRVQAYAEAYFKDHTYMYPSQIDDEFKCYFPGGDLAKKKPGNGLTNPFTGQAEFPVIGEVKDAKGARTGKTKPLKRGVIEYSPINGGKSYAVRGGGYTDKEISIVTGDSPYVLSRDNFEAAQTPGAK